MQTLLYDLSYAMRQLRKTPGLALLAILTLALGVGANTAIFTVIESVLLRPLPYAHSDRLVYIAPGDKAGFATTSWLNYRDIRDQSRQLDAIAGYSEDIGVVQNQEVSESVIAPRITPNLITMLGAKLKGNRVARMSRFSPKVFGGRPSTPILGSSESPSRSAASLTRWLV
jgi:putative ABC transport system permease protein